MADQVEVRLPELAEAMTSATLAAWLKKPGEAVTAGEPIAEVETDKTTVELEAPADGVLAEIRVAAGAGEVAVGTVLALLRAGGPDGDAEADADAEAAPGGAARPEAAAGTADAGGGTQSGGAANSGSASEAAPDSGNAGTATARDAPRPGAASDAGAAHEAASQPEAAEPPPGAVDAGGAGTAPTSATATAATDLPAAPAADLPPARPEPERQHPAPADVPATPLARRMAELAGLDLSSATGSGNAGRVTKADVERLLAAAYERAAAPVPPGRMSSSAAVAPDPATAPGASAVPGPPADVPADLPHTDRPLTAIRRVTAERLTEAKRSAPHFYLEIECAVDRLLALRDAAATAGGAGPTVNDVVVRAAALALRETPLANSAWTGGAVRVYEQVDLAVAVTTPAGLLTPVVRAADTKPLAEIAAELRRLTADARAGRLQPADYRGGTCTLSNLGMYGVSSLYAILNPPQSCILGVGAIAERPVVRDGVVTAGSTMKVTLSADHRAIDGATGAELLRALKALLEDPQPVYGDPPRPMASS